MSNGVESPRFTMDVLDLPTVDKLVLEYHFPAYTGLEPRTVDPGGDIAAIKGTEVHAEDHADDGDAGRARAAERERVGAAHEGSRRHARRQLHGERAGLLQDRARRAARGKGERVAAVHDRRAVRHRPVGALQQARPRHDGEPGRGSVRRSAGRRRLRREAAADVLLGERRRREDHESVRRREGAARGDAPRTRIYLEEMGLKPGDFVSYYAKAADNDAVAGAQDDDQRHLLRADQAVPQGLQAGAVDGRAAAAAAAAATRSVSSRSSSARSSRRRSTPCATRRR